MPTIVNRIDSIYTFAQNTFLRSGFVKDIVRSSAKQMISLGLLGRMLLKACVIPLLYLDFEIRRDYIVANLCENRNRPMLNCNGKCYLAKRMAEAKKQEEKQAESDFLSKLIAAGSDFSSFATTDDSRQVLLSFYQSSVTFDYNTPFSKSDVISEIFHPPLI